MACINNPITNIHLSTEEVLEMIDNARTSTNAVSDYDRSAGSTKVFGRVVDYIYQTGTSLTVKNQRTTRGLVHQ